MLGVNSVNSIVSFKFSDILLLFVSIKFPFESNSCTSVAVASVFFSYSTFTEILFSVNTSFEIERPIGFVLNVLYIKFLL